MGRKLGFDAGTPGFKSQLNNLLTGKLKQVTYGSLNLSGLIYKMRTVMPTFQSYNED